MHSALNRGLRLAAVVLCFAPGVGAAQQVTVGGVGAATSTAVGRAEAMVREGRRSEAADFLSQYLAAQPRDGAAWFFLGRMHLQDEEAWHRNGHAGTGGGPLQLDFAASAFEQAQGLLADSALLYRVQVGVERAINRIEEGGWQAIADWTPTELDLPLPPILRELGSNLLASCPRNGVLITGTMVETAAAWGVQLTRSDRLGRILVRSDLFTVDPRYQRAVALDLDVPSGGSLPELVASARTRRPICLGPLEDTTAYGGLSWRREGVDLVTGGETSRDSATVVVFELGRGGPAAPLWVGAVSAIYDQAARRNPDLCRVLRGAPAAQALSFPACRQ